MIALEPIELELDHQEWPECPEASILEDVTLGHLLNQGRPKVHGLGLVVRVFSEAEPLVDIKLRQVDDDGAVGRGDVRHVDHPATLDRNRKWPGEIRCVYNALRACQVTTTERINVHGDTR